MQESSPLLIQQYTHNAAPPPAQGIVQLSLSSAPDCGNTNVATSTSDCGNIYVPTNTYPSSF